MHSSMSARYPSCRTQIHVTVRVQIRIDDRTCLGSNHLPRALPAGGSGTAAGAPGSVRGRGRMRDRVVDRLGCRARLDGMAATTMAGAGRTHLARLFHYLLSRRHSSTASRIASPRPHFFLSVHRLIRASFPSLEVIMKTLLNSRSICGSTPRAFGCRSPFQ